MTKGMLKTMAAIAVVASLMISGANRIAMAQGASPAAPAPAMEEPGTKSFTLVSVEVDDTKFWLPSVIAVEQGDKVKLTLKNQVPGASNTHGFTIPAYNIAEVVTRGDAEDDHLCRRQGWRLPVFVSAASGAYRGLADRRTQEVGTLPRAIEI